MTSYGQRLDFGDRRPRTLLASLVDSSVVSTGNKYREQIELFLLKIYQVNLQNKGSKMLFYSSNSYYENAISLLPKNEMVRCYYENAISPLPKNEMVSYSLPICHFRYDLSRVTNDGTL